MNRQQGSNPPLRNMSNLSSQNSSSRNTIQSSRLVATPKAGPWGSTATSTNQSANQSNDSSSSWAQAMNTRGSSQLDLSSSSFPSLAGGSSQSQNPNSSASQWQSGPPQREQVNASQNPRIIQQRQQTLSTQRDSLFGSDNQRSEFSPSDQPLPRIQSNNIPSRGAPPGLSPADNTNTDLNNLTGGTSTQLRKSPVGQGMNGSIGQERSNGDIQTQSPQAGQPIQPRNQDLFLGRDNLSPNAGPEQTFEGAVKGMSEQDKWGMAGWHALHDGSDAEYKTLSRAQDFGNFGLNTEPGQSLLKSYAGPFAPSNSFPPKPLDTDYSIPDCYIVQNVAPINQRISGFTEDTLFFIFYTSPKDIIQEEVAIELMSRKWRFHMKEKMWLTRDDTTNAPVILEKDVCEQGYYIWWDYRNWKRIRKAYILRYEDLDDHLSSGRGLTTTPGSFQGGMNFGGSGNTLNGGDFNAVPGLERMAALGGRF